MGVVGLLVCPAFPLLFPGRAFAGRLMMVQAATCRVSVVKVLFHSAFHGVACGQCAGKCRVCLGSSPDRVGLAVSLRGVRGVGQLGS